jgi:hypothetical protein
MKNKNERRVFINKGLKSLSKFLVKNELPEELSPKTTKIKMLTPEGKLVEVESSAIKKRHNTTNKDILQWMNQNQSDPTDKK